MLNQSLALPLLESWVGYLWEYGRLHQLITPPDNGKGQGYAAWRVLPACDAWQMALETGLSGAEIDF
jgi:hypothetical protein